MKTISLSLTAIAFSVAAFAAAPAFADNPNNQPQTVYSTGRSAQVTEGRQAASISTSTSGVDALQIQREQHNR